MTVLDTPELPEFPVLEQVPDVELKATTSGEVGLETIGASQKSLFG
jgi:hypothetical protein